MVNDGANGVMRSPALLGNLSRGDSVIEIEQDLSQVENNNLGCRCAFGLQSSARRPSSARLKVTSSAKSSPAPAGKPWAMRVT